MSIHKEPNQEALRQQQINQRIYQWMYPERKDPAEIPYFCNSLDAMAKAEERFKYNPDYKDLWRKYLSRILSNLGWFEDVEQQIEIGGIPDQCLMDILTAPAHIRAEALVEILQESKK